VANSPAASQEDIRTVAELQRRAREEGGRVGRFAKRIADFAGTMQFLALHLTWFAVWVAINSRWIPGLPAFDPYPYVLLSVIVSCEAVLISTFVLIKQNAMSRAEDARDHLNLQIDLLSEREATKILQLQRLICRKLDIPEGEDEDARRLSAVTPIDKLARQVTREIIGPD
jgi:uncharacterized membrane protein